MAAVRFYFDYGSPASYLAWRRLPALIDRTGATVEQVPVLLGGLFKATGNVPPITVPAKGKWLFDDLTRWARRDAIPFKANPHFPLNTLKLMRGAVFARGRRELETYSAAIFDAMWREGRAMGESDVVATVLTTAGLDAAAYAAGIEVGNVKAELVANTEAAVEQGLFGAPSFVVNHQLFFGQDRMDFVEAALREAM